MADLLSPARRQANANIQRAGEYQSQDWEANALRSSLVVYASSGLG
jgi:hypothetical protein